MTFFKTAFSIFIIAMVLGACNKNTSTTLTPTVIDSLKIVFQDINTQIDVVWNKMIQDDDDKLDNMKRILQEVEFSGDYNRLKLDSLNKDIDKLTAVRYDQQTMSDSDLINLYDSMTTQVIGKVTVFTTRLSQFDQYPLMGELIQEVFEADDRVLRYRIDYDRAAKQYNSFIEVYEPDLHLVAKKKVLQPKPLFELQD